MIRIFCSLLVLLLLIPFTHADEDTLRVVAPWEIKGMDPTGAGYVFTRMQIGETLVEVDRNGRLIPGLAREWHVSDDQLTWTFPLRTGVTYHNGKTMTAESVALSLNHALAHSSVLKTAPITAISAEGDGIRVSLSQPFSPLPATLAHYSALILSKDSYENGKVVQIIATGPYQLSRFEPPQSLEVSAYPNYWGEQPAIQTAHYLAVGRGETRALMAESGDADIVYTLDPNSLKRLHQRRVVSVHAEPIPRTIVVKVNAGHPWLADAAVRRALSDAIDREGIALGIMKEPGAAAWQLFPPVMGDWYDPAIEPTTPDQSTLQQRLAEWGWKPGEDGILTKDGHRFELSLVTYSSRPLLPVVATALQDQWRALGIDVTVNIENSSAVPQKHHDGTLELALIARNYGSVVDPLGTLLEDYQDNGGDWGAMNWTHPALQNQLSQLKLTADRAQSSGHMRAIAHTLHEEMPTIPVAYYQHTAAVNNALTGFSLDPFERTYRLSELAWQ